MEILCDIALQMLMNCIFPDSFRTPKSARRLTEASDAPTPYTFRKRVKHRMFAFLLCFLSF